VAFGEFVFFGLFLASKGQAERLAFALAAAVCLAFNAATILARPSALSFPFFFPGVPGCITSASVITDAHGFTTKIISGAFIPGTVPNSGETTD
jgi:hypothetical protein